MERKQGVVVRPSRSIPGHQRPRLVVTSRTYMDIMTAGATAPAEQSPAAKATVQVKPEPQQPAFEVPSKAVPHTAPVIKPLSKVVIAPDPSPRAEEMPAELALLAEPDESDQSLAVAEASQPVPEVHHRPTAKPAPKSRGLFKKRKPLRHRIFHGMAALVFLAGIYVAVDGWLASRGGIEPQASALSAPVVKKDKADTPHKDTITENIPMGVGSYAVAPELPRMLHIPSLKVMARVFPLGEKNGSALKAPNNIYDAGWYTASARPADQTGAIVIDGRVSGPTRSGVFHDLQNLKANDEIVLERGDHRMLTFVVKQVESVKADQLDMTKLMKSATQEKLGLNLVTSTGAFSEARNSDQSRTVVYAVQK